MLLKVIQLDMKLVTTQNCLTTIMGKLHHAETDSSVSLR